MAKKKPANETPLGSAVIAQIEKQFGEGSIQLFGGGPVKDVKVVSTGILPLDIALGVGGLPKGRIIDIFSPESVGKTSIALKVAAKANELGELAALIDVEHAFDPSWAKKLGVNLNQLMISQPNSGEEAMQIVELLVKSGELSVIIVDSVAALVPRAELDGEIGDAHVGLQARLMSQSMRKLTGIVDKSGCCLIMINQIRSSIGGLSFGPNETAPGGRALKFYASVRIDLRKIGQIKDGEEMVGQRVRAKIVKNKLAPPFRIAEFDLLFASGFSRGGDIIDLGVAHGIIDKSGSWFKYGETYLGQGKTKAVAHLEDNKELAVEIEGLIMGKVRNGS